MSQKIIKTAILSMGLVLALRIDARAQIPPFSACPNQTYLHPGEAATVSAPFNALTYYAANLVAGHSYSLTVYPTKWGSSRLVVYSFIDNICMLPLYSTNRDFAAYYGEPSWEPFVKSTNPQLSFDGVQVSYIPTYDTNIKFGIANEGGGTEVRLLLMDTTLVSPWWFAGGNSQPFVEVRSNTESINADSSFTTRADLTAYGPSGDVCGSTTVQLRPNGNTAIPIKDLGSCADVVSGSAQIAFVGSPGGVTANITTINVAAGTSFDSPFTPKMVWGTFRR